MWLHVPSKFSTCSPARACSVGRFTAPSQCSASQAELWVTLSRKPMLRPLSWPGWRRRAWIRHLYGTISDPSRAGRGAARWIASLQATRASPSASPANAVGKAILATFGPRSVASLRKFNPASCSLRMSPTTCGLDTRPSSGICSDWATALHRDCLRRLKSGRAIRGGGSSSSGCWTTPCTPECGPEGRQAKAARGAGGQNLQYQTANWPTPASRDHKGANHRSHLKRSTGSRHLDQLPNYVRHCLPRARKTNDGLISCDEPRSLNPRFVEWMMGWPPGWTDCGSPVTEWFHYRRRMHSSLFSLVSGTGKESENSCNVSESDGLQEPSDAHSQGDSC